MAENTITFLNRFKCPSCSHEYSTDHFFHVKKEVPGGEDVREMRSRCPRCAAMSTRPTEVASVSSNKSFFPPKAKDYWPGTKKTIANRTRFKESLDQGQE